MLIMIIVLVLVIVVSHLIVGEIIKKLTNNCYCTMISTNIVKSSIVKYYIWFLLLNFVVWGNFMTS